MFVYGPECMMYVHSEATRGQRHCVSSFVAKVTVLSCFFKTGSKSSVILSGQGQGVDLGLDCEFLRGIGQAETAAGEA